MKRLNLLFIILAVTAAFSYTGCDLLPTPLRDNGEDPSYGGTEAQPPVPSGLSLMPQNPAEPASITVSWAEVPEAASYHVYWSTGDVLTAETQNELSSQPAYTISNLSYDIDYKIWVRSVTSQKVYSREAAVITAAVTRPVPEAPANLVLEAPNPAEPTSVTISWAQIPGASKYAVYWDTSDEITDNTDCVFTTSTSHTITDLAYDNMYNIWVKTVSPLNVYSLEAARLFTMLPIKLQGDLDKSFLLYPEMTYTDDVAVAEDGKIYIAARTAGQLFLFRLLPDGSEDPGFGSGGVLRKTSPQIEYYNLNLLLQDQKITAFKNRYTNGPSFYDLDTDSFIDTNAGIYPFDHIAGPDGGVYVAGRDSGKNFIAAKFDSLLSDTPRQIFKYSAGETAGVTDFNEVIGYSLSLSDSGDLYASGWFKKIDPEAYPSTTVYPYCVRLSAETGEKLNSFSFDAPAWDNRGYNLINRVAPDGSVFLASHSIIGKFDEAGRIDAGFGTGGVFTDFGSNLLPIEIFFQEDGKIIFVLRSNSGDGEVCRFNSDGTLDYSFGLSGKITTYDFEIYSAALAFDGKIILAGKDLKKGIGAVRFIK